MEAVQTLFVENQALIYSIIYKYFNDYPDKEDLFQEAYKAFETSYHNYNEQFQVKFTTYAYRNIVWHLKHYITQNKVIRSNREMTKLLLQIEKATVVLTQQMMREPTIFEIAEMIGVSECKVSEALNSIIYVNSLDEPVCQDGKELLLYDTVPDPATADMDLASYIALRQELEKLTPMDRSLIEARYFRDCTQSETASMLGMSQVQVSRRETKVLQLLRERCAS